MYRHNNHKGEILHTVDLSTLRKPNTLNICKLEQTSLEIINHSNSVLLLLGIHALIQQNTENELQFNDFHFDNVPKQYQQYCHEKTFTEIMGVFRNRGKSIEEIVDILNNYPICVTALECWVRKKAITILQSNSNTQYLGNQHDLLIDLNVQIRGPLLGIVTNSLRGYVKIKYEIHPSVAQDNSIEEFGDPYSRWQLQIIVKGNNTVSCTVVQKESDQSPTYNYSKQGETGFLRRSKMIDSEVEPRVGAQFKSVKKQRFGPCERCGQRRCDCNQIKRKGFGVTPKNAQLSTSTIGHKSDPFAIGFLNEHNISKIRESNPGQK